MAEVNDSVLTQGVTVWLQGGTEQAKAGRKTQKNNRRHRHVKAQEMPKHSKVKQNL